jgi:hypothetical protein
MELTDTSEMWKSVMGQNSAEMAKKSNSAIAY